MLVNRKRHRLHLGIRTLVGIDNLAPVAGAGTEGLEIQPPRGVAHDETDPFLLGAVVGDRMPGPRVKETYVAGLALQLDLASYFAMGSYWLPSLGETLRVWLPGITIVPPFSTV